MVVVWFGFGLGFRVWVISVLRLIAMWFASHGFAGLGVLGL